MKTEWETTRLELVTARSFSSKIGSFAAAAWMKDLAHGTTPISSWLGELYMVHGEWLRLWGDLGRFPYLRKKYTFFNIGTDKANKSIILWSYWYILQDISCERLRTWTNITTYQYCFLYYLLLGAGVIPPYTAGSSPPTLRDPPPPALRDTLVPKHLKQKVHWGVLVFWWVNLAGSPQQ